MWWCRTSENASEHSIVICVNQLSCTNKRATGEERRAQPSLCTDRPGSLVGGVVRSCEELPKLESCLPCSSCPFGLRLKKFLNRPVVFFLPGLNPVDECEFESGCDVGGFSIDSLGGYGTSWSPFLLSRVVRRFELICRHQLESRDRSDRVAPLSPLILLLSHCCRLAPSRLPLAPCERSISEWLCGDDCWTGYSSTTGHVRLVKLKGGFYILCYLP